MNERQSPPHFIFEAVGSRGDVIPPLAIAAELTRRGYRCQLLGNEHFRAEALEQGVGFTATTDLRVNFSARDGHGVDKYLFPAFSRTREHFRQAGAHAESTIVVNFDRWAASDALAESHALRTVRLHLCPFKIRSLESPSWPLGANVSGLLGQTYRKYTLPGLYEAFDTDPKVLARVNGVRSRVGLAPVASALYAQPHVVAEAALFPLWYGPPAGDWPEMPFLGFPLPPSRQALPARLLQFLERCPRPLVFTPGTSVAENAAFFDAATACCAELGLPGLLLSPFLRSTRRLGPQIAHFPHVELESLLPHCRLIVHHGGVGTTARALQAGVPQVISPSVFDQPDNGHRVEQLGVGRVVSRAELDGHTLAAAVRGLLRGETSERLHQYRERVAEQSCVSSCAALLETVARGESTPRSVPSRVAAASHATPRAARACPAASTPRPTILIIAWPEPGHTVGPFALARQLERRGARVVFAGAGFYRQRIEAAGYEFVDLAAPPGRAAACSVFSPSVSRSTLPEAVNNLIDAFDYSVRRHAPCLVLMDSLYSAFALLAEARRLAWATYETDLPRELDLGAPPAPRWPDANATPAADRGLRSAWARLLWATYQRRRDGRQRGPFFGYSMQTCFPDALCKELRRRLGAKVEFDRRSYFPPLARGPRLVLSIPELDFQRRNTEGIRYLGPCVDTERTQAAFPWASLREKALFSYCTLGTQSVRESRGPRVLQAVVDAHSRPSDPFLVLSCPEQWAAQLRYDGRRVLVVNQSPQLSLLSQASLCIHHGGFNTLKECALEGVPQLVLPLCLDQHRNGQLVAERGLGSVLDAVSVSSDRVRAAASALLGSASLRDRCRSMQQLLQRANRGDLLSAALSELFAAFRFEPAQAEPARERSLLLDRLFRDTGADGEFSRELEQMLRAARRFLRVPASVADPIVEREFAELRRELEHFRIEFRSRHAELVRNHLTPARQAEFASAAPANRAQRFSSELESIQRDSRQALRELTQRMTRLPLYGVADAADPRGQPSPLGFGPAGPAAPRGEQTARASNKAGSAQCSPHEVPTGLC